MKSPRPEIRESEVTPEALFLRRREFLRAAAAVSLVAVGEAKSAAAQALEPLADAKPAPAGSFRATDELTHYESATAYNNFYEFGTDKGTRQPMPAACVRSRGRWRSKVK